MLRVVLRIGFAVASGLNRSKGYWFEIQKPVEFEASSWCW